MVTAYAADGDSFRAEKPQPWSGGRFNQSGPARMFDLHPEGNRVALASASSASDGARRDHVTVIFNFFDELNRIAPRGKR